MSLRRHMGVALIVANWLERPFLKFDDLVWRRQSTQIPRRSGESAFPPDRPRLQIGAGIPAR